MSDTQRQVQVLHRMFVGDPLGEYDRSLDFSPAVTGATFFMSSNDLLQQLGV
ncbi:MAG TPA: hypothetical protein VFS83_20120 [Ktedonobacterales bacterium]|nr:hypothetical protein [Ktedonobacterales bacterium]